MIKTLWLPVRFTVGFDSGPEQSVPAEGHSVLVLNVPIKRRELFLRVCAEAQWIVCADGGANRVRDLQLESDEETRCEHIDCIIGDLDSAHPDVLAYYEARDAEIKRKDDQNSTDLQKGLSHLQELHEKNPVAGTVDIAIFGGLEGRADQALSQLHQLYVASRQKAPGSSKIYLITSTSVIFLLERGWNRIDTPIGNSLFNKHVGIVPLAGPAIVTTRGFKWNLDNEELAFGKFVSTSNWILDPYVEVETTNPVILTLELAP